MPQEFYKLAAFWLLCRFQVYNHRECIKVSNHVSSNEKLLFVELSMLGMIDTEMELSLLCKEKLKL